MAEHEYFNIGSIVCCTTCYNQKVQGEVLAYDVETKMLAIKTPAASGKHNVYDVRLLNLAFVGDVEVISDGSMTNVPLLTSLNLNKINSRLKGNLDEKKRQVNYIGVGVTPEGQRLFHAIVKTISETKWDGKDIVVMDEVRIHPPYGVTDCSGKESSHSLNHVKKIVKKYLDDTETQRNNDLRKSMSPSPASSASSS
ncbi:hypothetical protein ScPMuIL_015233 [Solemya velum]